MKNREFLNQLIEQLEPYKEIEPLNEMILKELRTFWLGDDDEEFDENLLNDDAFFNSYLLNLYLENYPKAYHGKSQDEVFENIDSIRDLCEVLEDWAFHWEEPDEVDDAEDDDEEVV